MVEISCADIGFQFPDFIEEPVWKDWEWKIDPWRCKLSTNISDKSVVKIMRAEDKAVLPESLLVLFTERTGFFERRICQMSDDETLWNLVRVKEEKIYLQFKVNAAWDKVTLLRDITGTKGHASFEYLAQITPGIYLKHHILTLHAALMEYKGVGFAVCASSGTGKTTHARLWRDYKNALILNGDRAVCKKDKSVWTAYGTPWSGTSGEQINRSVPIVGVVVLERGERNVVWRITNPLEAFTSLFLHVQYPSWNTELVNRAMDLTEGFLSEVPILHLQCLPDLEAVDILEQAIRKL